MAIINTNSDKEVHSNCVRLSDMKQGEEAVISRFEEGEDRFQRLQDIGLLTGTNIRLIRFAPLGDPIQIKARGTYLSLRKSAAEQIWVIRK